MNDGTASFVPKTRSARSQSKHVLNHTAQRNTSMSLYCVATTIRTRKTTFWYKGGGGGGGGGDGGEGRTGVVRNWLHRGRSIKIGDAQGRSESALALDRSADVVQQVGRPVDFDAVVADEAQRRIGSGVASIADGSVPSIVCVCVERRCKQKNKKTRHRFKQSKTEHGSTTHTHPHTQTHSHSRIPRPSTSTSSTSC